MASRLWFLLWVACAACGPGRWVWRQPDVPHDPKRLREDIDACEEYRKAAEARGPFGASSGARPVGGWGNANFEFCMNERNWKLQYLQAPGQGE